MTDLTWDDIKAIVPLAEAERVSTRARSPNQIVDQYRRYMTTSALPLVWQRKRIGFIHRHMAQYVKHPTYRRFLALIMWGYLPDLVPPEVEAGLKN